MTRPPWILATRNAGKLRELRALFADAGIDVIDLDAAGIGPRAEEEEIEVHDTFVDNALAKARYYAARAPGRVVVADDSGLEVQALGGAPGVRSKRWSARDDLSGDALVAANNALLVARLDGVADRRARFVCAAAWCDGVTTEVALGEVAGTIVSRGAGAEGFGYDPHFFATELGRTLAEASVAEKQRVSHRGRAFASLLDRLRARGIVSRGS
ncbi:MAG TPA: non-canonical purine NTP pyrophosphatase [Gemmatimonadaceae bacterium]|nr:non-canonical purine NTP pyrophosphatase [Gemmatimonadaceae bacterium]